MIIEELIQHFGKPKKCSDGYFVQCPCHDDSKNSLHITQNEKGIALYCHAGCQTKDIIKAVGLKMSDLFAEPLTPLPKAEIVAKYKYYDLTGQFVAVKYRYSDKSFKWKQPNNVPKKPNIPLLYNWQNAKKYDTVYFVEGEKDVDTLATLKLPAVSVPDGAKTNLKWLPEWTQFFSGRNVVIIPDNDDAGRALKDICVNNIFSAAKAIKVLDLKKIWSTIPAKADVTDYLNSGGTLEQLDKLRSDTEPLTVESPYVSFTNLEAAKTKWLWYPYIPSGKITLMTADPGTGKTFLSLYITAMVSNGSPFYGQEDFETRQPRVAVYQTAEDGLADTIKPRLMKFKPAANFENITAYNESIKAIDFSTAPDIIEKIMKDTKPALIIFDPLQAYLGAGIDMHRANEVRPVLAKIGHLAEKYECAVIFIMHNSKANNNDPLQRALGSIDIVGIARSMLILGKNPDDSKQVVMCHEKSSLAAHGKSILFHIDDTDGIIFDGLTDMRASDVLSHRKRKKDRPSVKLDEAIQILESEMNEEGWIEYNQVKDLCKQYGISSATINRAKKELTLNSVIGGYGNSKTSYWLLPSLSIEEFKRNRLCEIIDTSVSDIPPF